MQALGAFRDEKSAPLSSTSWRTPITGRERRDLHANDRIARQGRVDDSHGGGGLKTSCCAANGGRAAAPRDPNGRGRALRSRAPRADRALRRGDHPGPGAVRKIAVAAMAEPATPRRRKEQAVAAEEIK